MINESIETKIRIKQEIAYQLSRILLTIHNLTQIKYHGHLSSHNIFVDIKKISEMNFNVFVKISDIENGDFMEYANMFFNYKISSVWSSPEVLEQLKKIPKVQTS
jgi:hypothetical protein